MKIFYLILFYLITNCFYSLANVTVTAPNLTINTCAFPSAYSNLGNIVIDEGANGDFAVGAAKTLILTAPANFQFNPGIGAISQNAAPVNLSALGIVVTATTITITFTSGGTNRDDILTISGIQVRAITGASSGNVLRTAGSPGTGTIAGIVNGTTSFASLTSNLSCGCNHTVRLTDTFGDGWNGGTVSIRVNGVDVLTNITFGAGSGPVDFTFTAATGDVVTVVETAGGSFPNEMRVEVFDGGMTSIIAQHDPNGGTNGNGNCPPPMSITAATVTQSSTTSISNCSSNVQIVRLEITTTGVTTPKSVTQIQTRFTGSAAIAGITTEKIYFTGNSGTFSTATLFGTGVPSTVTHSINGAQNLVNGVNYFWLVYNINNAALVGTTVDGEVTQFTASAVNYNSGSAPAITVTNPAGSRTLTLCLAPGGVSANLETWIRADLGTTGTTPITAWSNQNTSGTAVLINGSPNLNTVSTSYNYNPFVDFTAPVGTLSNGAAANRQFLKYSGFNVDNGLNLTTLFFAFQLNDLTRITTHIGTVENITYSGGPANGTIHGAYAGPVASLNESAYDSGDFGAGAPASTWQRNSTNLSYSANHLATKHILSANCTTGGNMGINRLLGGQIDQADPNTFAGHFRDWKGPVSEIITFSSAITAVERQKIDSYLALKYGITLPINYLSTTGGTIFTTTAPYNNNIIGIGRDDVEALTQKQSHQDDDLVRIYLSTLVGTNSANTGSFASDVSYVVMGSNSGALCASTASNAEIPVGLPSCALYSRMEREWKITRTNMAQNFNIDVKLSACGAPGSVTVSHLRLLVDDDGNFSNGGTQCYYNGDGTGLVFTYSNPTITISNISTAHFPNNVSKFYTIASIDAATPLPIELISFDAKLNAKNTVDLTWKTQSERENDFFTIEKSIDGINWSVLGNVNGAGTTSEQKSYYLEDEYPVNGINYYLLTQTDFNGQKTIVDVKTVELYSDDLIVLYPNPTSNKVNLYGKDISKMEIELYDNLGKKIEFTKNIISIDHLEINTESFANGLYYVSFKNKIEQEIRKLMIRH